MKVIFTHKGGRKQSMQRRYADILQKLGRGTYMTRDMRAEREESELTALRSEYQEIVGKRAYHGWDSDELRERIAEGKARATPTTPAAR